MRTREIKRTAIVGKVTRQRVEFLRRSQLREAGYNLDSEAGFLLAENERLRARVSELEALLRDIEDSLSHARKSLAGMRS